MLQNIGRDLKEIGETLLHVDALNNEQLHLHIIPAALDSDQHFVLLARDSSPTFYNTL